MERLKSTILKSVIIPAFILSLGQLSVSYAEDISELNMQAVELMEKGNYQNALQLLLKAHDQSPTHDVIRKNIASCYSMMGNSDISKGNFKEAVSHFVNSLYYNENPQIIFYKGYSYYRLKELDDAANDIEEAIASGFSSPQAYILAGKVYYDKADLAAAIVYWQKGMELYPEDAEFGKLLDKAEREVKVERAFKKEDASHFTIQYDAEKSERLGSLVLGVLEDAYADVNLDLAHYPDGNTVVLIYALREFKEATESPDWSGGLYDGKIRIPAGGLSEISPALKAVLYHEYTHVVVRSMTSDKNVPTWLNEGIAEYEGARFEARSMEHLAMASRQGKLIPIKKLEGDFSRMSKRESVLAYEQSSSFVRYIIDQYGLHSVREMLEGIGRGKSTADAIKEALDIYSIDYETLVSNWEESIR